MCEALNPMTGIPENSKDDENMPIPLYVDYPEIEPPTKRRRLSDGDAKFLNAILDASVSDGWLKMEPPIYIRPCYEKMAALLTDSESLCNVSKLTYVVKGTPGIGKTTMLSYLVWRCTRHDSPFTVVLFATSTGAFVLRKSGSEWRIESFDEGNVEVGEVGKAIGLVDISPEGTVMVQNRSVMHVNQQGPCSSYGLHRLVVAASAGAQLGQLIGKDMDGSFPKEMFLPAWQPTHLRQWAAK
jgi:hypothetical protein